MQLVRPINRTQQQRWRYMCEPSVQINVYSKCYTFYFDVLTNRNRQLTTASWNRQRKKSVSISLLCAQSINSQRAIHERKKKIQENEIYAYHILTCFEVKLTKLNKNKEKKTATMKHTALWLEYRTEPALTLFLFKRLNGLTSFISMKSSHTHAHTCENHRFFRQIFAKSSLDFITSLMTPSL